jgi:hypothetical protein
MRAGDADATPPRLVDQPVRGQQLRIDHGQGPFQRCFGAGRHNGLGVIRDVASWTTSLLLREQRWLQSRIYRRVR